MVLFEEDWKMKGGHHHRIKLILSVQPNTQQDSLPFDVTKKPQFDGWPFSQASPIYAEVSARKENDSQQGPKDNGLPWMFCPIFGSQSRDKPFKFRPQIE